MPRPARLPPMVLSWAALGWLVCTIAVAGDAPPTEGLSTDGPLTFERHVRPILKAHCWQCHGGDGEAQSHLDLRLKRLIADGGDSGPAIMPGDAAASLVYRRIVAGEMPPGEKKLSAEEIALIGRWLDGGATNARDEPPGSENDLIAPEDREFWSFRPLQRPAVPESAAEDRARAPIDRFLLAKLKPLGLQFSPDADRPTLIKRVYFDLLGLPPSPDEVAAFLADGAPDAYEQLVDRALASPHYGERWGRHWLDTAGYADSDGYNDTDAVRSYAYKYRDYVIRAFNADKPFDQFIREQLAGDELVSGPYHALAPEDLDRVAATGFLRMGADGTASASDAELARNQVLAETIKIVSTSLLGLTVGCCQCHDHRYDPLPTVDYYRLRAVFEPAYDWKNWRTPDARLVSLYTEADRQRVAEVEAQAAVVVAERSAKEQAHIVAAFDAEVAKLPEELRDPIRAAYQTAAGERTPEQTQLLDAHPAVNVSAGTLYQYNQPAADELKTFDARISEIYAQRPVQDFVAPLNEPAGALPATFVFYRGDHRQPQQQVSPGGLAIVSPPGAPYDSGRRPGAPHHGAAVGLGPVAHRRPAAPHRPRAGESNLDAPFWPRHRGHARRFRPDGRPADTSRVARLARQRVQHRLVAEGPAPADDALHRLPAVVAARDGGGSHRSGQSPVVADARSPLGGRSAARSRAGDQRAIESSPVRSARSRSRRRRRPDRDWRRSSARLRDSPRRDAAARSRRRPPQRLHSGPPQPAAAAVDHLRRAGDGNQLRSAAVVDRRSPGPAADE